MQAWRVYELGSVVFEPSAAVPALDMHDTSGVLVKVEAAGPNFADSLMIAGTYQEKAYLPFTPGFEVSGVVVESRDDRFDAGERVVGTTRPGWGAWAEYALCDADHLVTVPDGVATDDAVAIHVNAQTAWFGLHHRAGIAEGDMVLVNAAAGGVGTMAVQLAVAAGATVIATSSGSKVQVAKDLGAKWSFDNRSDDWPTHVREVTNGRGVDIVIDMVGGSVFDESWRLLAFEGRLVVVGFTSGEIGSVKANHALVKNVSLEGLYWGRYQDDAPHLVREAAVDIFQTHIDGYLDPIITARDHMTNAQERLAEITEGRTTGKIVLTW